MNPVAFELFGYPIRWYGIIIAGGVLVAFFISYILAKKKELDFDIITDGFLWSFPFAIIGARLYYVAFEYKNYHSFIDVINIRNGGMAIHGGLIGGLLTAYIFTNISSSNWKMGKFHESRSTWRSGYRAIYKQVSAVYTK